MKNYPLGVKQHSLNFILYSIQNFVKKTSGSQFVLKPHAIYLLFSNKVQIYTCTLYPLL